MTTTGDVEINITDGAAGAVVVPAASVQLVIGTCSGGNAATIVATRSPQTLQTSLGYGLLPEAAALACAAGGTVLAMKAATNAAGYVAGSTAAALTVSGATNASPIVITTSAAHGLLTGAVVTVASVGGNTGANGTFVITKLSNTTFSLNGSTGSGAYTSGGTVQPRGSTFSGTGTSVITLSLDGTNGAFDDYFVLVTCTKGGTIGATGIRFTLSLDAGRQIGPTISLDTATSYTIPNTGITLNFAAGTLVAGDTFKFSTVAPTASNAGIQACLQAFQASPYATVGIGSIHVVGVAAGADATTIQGYLDTLATGYLFEGAMLSARDAQRPAAWGGSGEAESAWMTSIQTDFASVSAKRVLCGAGYYNMQSPFPNAAAGAPRYRRSLTWAQAARQVAIPAQRHSGRVRDGALSQIVVDAINDPLDGFIYHDERINPGLDVLTGGAGRFCSARTRVGKPGVYIVNPLMLSPVGSDFDIWPKRQVMDVACSITHQTAQDFVNEDLRLNANGTIYENDAKNIETEVSAALADAMTNVGMISGASVVVDRSVNVRSTKRVRITVTINARGYVLEVDLYIGYASANAA